jgi:hypothetical protein
MIDKRGWEMMMRAAQLHSPDGDTQVPGAAAATDSPAGDAPQTMLIRYRAPPAILASRRGEAPVRESKLPQPVEFRGIGWLG